MVNGALAPVPLHLHVAAAPLQHPVASTGFAAVPLPPHLLRARKAEAGDTKLIPGQDCARAEKGVALTKLNPGVVH